MQRCCGSAASIVLLVMSLLAGRTPAEETFTPAAPDQWAQWRGPSADGSSPSGDPPIEWSLSRNVRWKREIPGKGSGSPIIWGDKLFLTTAVPTDRPADPASKPAADVPPSEGRRLALDAPTVYHQFLVLCLDRHSGEILWKQTANEAVPHEGGHPTNSFASASPITDGRRLFVSFGSFGVYCYDLNGKLQWKRDLGRMETRNDFGEGSSPALHGDTLVLTWDQEANSFITALDARSGETLWKVDRDEPTTWATPFITQHDGVTQVVTNGTNRVRSYELKTGELLWACGGQFTNPIACPIRFRDLAIAMTGYRGYAVYAVPLSARGDVSDTATIAWKRNDAGPYISSPVLYDGTLYFTKARDAILYSVDPAQGTPIIEQQRIPGLGTLYASPVAAAGRLYFTDRDGTTVVLKHGPQLEVLATNRLEEVIDASPAVIGSRLYLRGEKHLFCLENSAP